MSDLARVFAFAYRRKGLDRMPGGDLRLLLAYDLRWFAPEDAKAVVARGLETGLLTQEGDEVAVAFDPAAVDVPVNFRPARDVIDEEPSQVSLPPPPPPPPPAPSSAAPAAPAAEDAHEEKSDAPPAEPADAAAVEAERKRRGNLLTPDVARLVVARRKGEDVRDRLADVGARLTEQR